MPNFFSDRFKKYCPNFPPDKEVAKCEQAYTLFKCWDFDDTGFLEFDELKQVLWKLNSQLTEQDATEAATYALMLADEDMNGKLDPLEFVTLLDKMLFGASDEARTQLIDELLKLVQSMVAPPKLKRKSKKLFSAWDFDGSGTLDKKELGAIFSVLNASLNDAETEEEVTYALSVADANSDGKIEEGEFIALMEHILSDYPVNIHGKIMDSLIDLVMEKAKENKPKLFGVSEKLYKAWDFDDSGYLDFHELAEVLGQVNSALNDEQAAEDAHFALSVADTSGDGKIDRNEFIKLMNVMLADVPEEYHGNVMKALLALVESRRVSP